MSLCTNLTHIRFSASINTFYKVFRGKQFDTTIIVSNYCTDSADNQNIFIQLCKMYTKIQILISLFLSHLYSCIVSELQ